jgi:hypothetical protein
MVVLHDALTRGEQHLVAAGQPEAVRGMRRTFHDLMREEASLAVEDVLGRRVTAFLADIDPEAHVAALVFTLAPRPETDATEETTGRAGSPLRSERSRGQHSPAVYRSLTLDATKGSEAVPVREPGSDSSAGADQ